MVCYDSQELFHLGNDLAVVGEISKSHAFPIEDHRLMEIRIGHRHPHIFEIGKTEASFHGLRIEASYRMAQSDPSEDPDRLQSLLERPRGEPFDQKLVPG